MPKCLGIVDEGKCCVVRWVDVVGDMVLVGMGEVVVAGEAEELGGVAVRAGKVGFEIG